MSTLDTLDRLYIAAALLFQSVLAIHFAVRGWRLETAIHYGWIVYALSLPAFALSIAQIVAGKAWYFWIAGVLYLVWGVFGFVVEYGYQIVWRDPIRWSIFAPYVALYLATCMFYWWPLARISRMLWIVAGVLFALSTVLNITSHPPSESPQAPPVQPVQP